MGDDQKIDRKPEFYQQLGPDYIKQLRKETFAKVAALSGRGEFMVMRFFERINWRGKRESSPENAIREALYPPIPEHLRRTESVDLDDFYGRDAKSQQEHDARLKKKRDREAAEREARESMKRIVFLLSDLRAQCSADASLARQAEARKQRRLRSARTLTQAYGEETHV